MASKGKTATAKYAHADHTRRAASLIASGFTWSETEEGGDFWSDITTRLERIARNIETIQKAEPLPAKL